MICTTPLTPQQKKKSQKNYCYFYAINGISYMCLGETVLTLLAIKMKCPDYIVSTLGAMLYLGYLLLPLGRTASAKLGGAGAQSFFWVCRNISAATVGVGAIFSYYGHQYTALFLLLVGAFFFYGFRAAGVVMSQPLVGDIADENGSGKLLAISNGIFFFFRLTTLIIITLVVRYSDNIWTLVGIIMFGAMCGVTSAKFLRDIDETTAISDSAKKPVMPDIKWGLKFEIMRKQLFTGFCYNLAWIMTIPVTALAVKRGFNATDADVLVFTMSLSAGCCIMSFTGGKIANAIGPRKLMIIAHILFIFTSIVWVILPDNLPYIYMLFHFFILGTATIWGHNAAPHYFLQTIPQEKQVGTSILLSVVTGVIAGLSGTVISGILLKVVPLFSSTPLEGYKLFFVLTAIILLPGTWLFKALLPLPIDKKSISKQLFMQINSFISRHH